MKPSNRRIFLQEEQSAQLLAKLGEKERECEEYRKELEEVKEESSTLNQSLTDLDRDHEVIVGQLIEQRDSLRRQHESVLQEVRAVLPG